MLTIVSGDVEEAKEELKGLLSKTSAALSKFKKSVSKDDRSWEETETIRNHETFLNTYRVTKMLPVKVGGIIVNYKLYELMMKKLKKFDVTVEIKSNRLLLKYSNSISKGCLELHDLSPRVGGVLKKIPVAEVMSP